jgi:hypothetical protein
MSDNLRWVGLGFIVGFVCGFLVATLIGPARAGDPLANIQPCKPAPDTVYPCSDSSVGLPAYAWQPRGDQPKAFIPVPYACRVWTWSEERMAYVCSAAMDCGAVR